MTAQTIRKAVQQRPLQRFSVRLADGSRVQVPRENYVAVYPKGKTMIVFDEDGGYRVLDIALIGNCKLPEYCLKVPSAPVLSC